MGRRWGERRREGEDGGGQGMVFIPTRFNFDRAGSHPIRPRLDRCQPLPAAGLFQPRSPHRSALEIRPTVGEVPNMHRQKMLL